nr:molybdopterin-binding protein [uncultured Oscillibacter sp.]
MKLINTTDAVGHVLCHDMTQIIKGEYKDARFRKGHVVREEDIPVLLSMGKEHLYVWEMVPGMVHENDAAERLCALCVNENMERGGVKEGKIELTAACDGLFQVDSRRLTAVNSIEDIIIATRHGNTGVRRGDRLAGARVIPLVIREEKLLSAEEAAGPAPLLELLPYVKRTAAIVATGSEVKSGLIQDAFTPVVRDKLAEYGIETLTAVYSGDGVENVANAISEVRRTGAEIILCTGGMSVDPDDNTPGGIRASGARIVSYGAPVLPGAMLLVGYYEDGTPVLGLPGCVMYAGATIFDLLLPRIAAGVEITREEKLLSAEEAAGPAPLLELLPYVKRTAAIVATGSEVKSGLIQDAFTPVVRDKLAEYGIETLTAVYSGDGVENVANAISEVRRTGAEIILCTGGMSVDPDDNTPGGIRASGARIVSYGAPVLPGAMLLVGYYEDGTPVLGLPGCVMYAGATIFDLLLPRIAAGVEITREEIAAMGEGGLCLGCKPCRWPHCPFGK